MGPLLPSSDREESKILIIFIYHQLKAILFHNFQNQSSNNSPIFHLSIIVIAAFPLTTTLRIQILLILEQIFLAGS